jgi:hypothetical protein
MSGHNFTTGVQANNTQCYITLQSDKVTTYHREGPPKLLMRTELSPPKKVLELIAGAGDLDRTLVRSVLCCDVCAVVCAFSWWWALGV